MIYDITLWYRGMYIAGPTKWDKVWLLFVHFQLLLCTCLYLQIYFYVQNCIIYFYVIILIFFLEFHL